MIIAIDGRAGKLSPNSGSRLTWCLGAGTLIFGTGSKGTYAMANVVIADLKRKKLRSAGKSSVRKKLLRNSDGQFVQVLSMDANSATFSDDLTEIFSRNVAKARRENKKLFGSASGFRAKKK